MDSISIPRSESSPGKDSNSHLLPMFRKRTKKTLMTPGTAERCQAVGYVQKWWAYMSVQIYGLLWRKKRREAQGVACYACYACYFCVRSFQTHLAHLSRDDGQLQNGAATATEWPQCQMISLPARWPQRIDTPKRRPHHAAWEQIYKEAAGNPTHTKSIKFLFHCVFHEVTSW